MIYRPPEMVDFYAEFPISEKVDVWMIGCILYTLMFYRQTLCMYWGWSLLCQAYTGIGS
ncbi:Gak [Symbiodinium pilosum]|uniref:non-specific serine/threonine protein kinase n=1 Tax=Symbiodinium pilosum TaxID=2952 RepID=A0A812IWS9_SYMPI|nr:Gak [Symbiodinium pilosum]